MTAVRTIVATIVVLAAIAGCSPAASSSPSPSGDPSAATSSADPGGSSVGSLVLLGRIITMADPPVAEALFIEDGTVAAVGTKDEVLAAAGDQVPVVDIGENVAYPGFIDAHAHWIGDRNYYAVDTAEAAMDLAIARGWTSISEQWVNPEKLEELTGLAADGALPLRVDGYLALNFDKEFFGDWYASREPGPVDDDLRVQGLKIHLDDGGGSDGRRDYPGLDIHQ